MAPSLPRACPSLAEYAQHGRRATGQPTWPTSLAPPKAADALSTSAAKPIDLVPSGSKGANQLVQCSCTSEGTASLMHSRSATLGCLPRPIATPGLTHI